MKFFLANIRETLEILGTSAKGLQQMEAEQRLITYGKNELIEKKKKPAWLLFLAQFKELMTLILLLAAIVSWAIGDAKDAAIILVIVALNAIVGFVQEYRAEKAMEELKKMASAVAKVMRDGKMTQLPASQIVQGDIVHLEAGDIVPADLRLIEVHSLKTEEASLTGESYSIEKKASELKDENASLGDQINMVFKSTIVSYGRATGVVVSTGMQTEIGKIAGMLQQPETQTPLQQRMADFSKKLSVVIGLICVVIYITGILRGEDQMQMLLTAISVAVAAIPEALPAVITIALALGARKMVTENALIRKLPAVETLGSVNFICSDKTGTLTQNKMAVREIWTPHNNEIDHLAMNANNALLLAMLLNQDTRLHESEIVGDPTEIAAVVYAQKQLKIDEQTIKSYQRTEEIPFDSVRKMMTSVHQFNQHYLVITKGAVESVLKKCININEKSITHKADSIAEQGMRTLAYAYKIISAVEHKHIGNHQHKLEKDLHFLGVIGMIDPPRPEVIAAVEECKTAGIIPVMITGDHPKTALAIATEIGIATPTRHDVLTGVELAELSFEQLKQKVETVCVYARVSPEQKLNIVKALQENKHYVAMTGDGVNDAPSLKRANIGIAMGITGTDVSKEAAHMILLDDNFSTIVKAIKEGRRIFDNIRRFIRYIMTGNAGEIWTIFLAPIVGLPIPLLPIHILWINLVTDGLPSLALANEPAEVNIMKRPPRKSSDSMFSDGVGLHIVWVGLLIGLLCLGIQAWAIKNNTHWQTMVFTALSLCQLSHVMAIRSDHEFIYKHGILNNKFLLLTVLLTTLLQLAIVYVPFLQTIFSTNALNLTELLLCFAAAAIVFHAVELEKWIKMKRNNG
jgi:Ca2+-transporting ATPase